jgi:hypothetical protein
MLEEIEKIKETLLQQSLRKKKRNGSVESVGSVESINKCK